MGSINGVNARLGQEIETLNHPQTLSGEDILPGFILNLRDIWSD